VTVSKIDASTGATVGTIPVGASPTGVAFDGVYLWVVDFETGLIGSKIRPADGTVLGRFFTPQGATAIVAAAQRLFVVSGRTVWEYR
jgi:DNA-binding beta-propeller fold protein YncE